jgi:KaiC/GvpD/RAD55 family RecA-like ATPase
MERDLPLVSTHVAGLDEALGGGIPQGSIVLVAGTPGTMKSSLIYNIMYHGARTGRRGLYITLEQTTESLKIAMERMGYGPMDEGKLYVLDLGILRTAMKKAEAAKDWVGIIVDIVKEAVAVNGYQILALDSMEALYALANFEVPRRELFQLYASLRELGLTTFLVTETPIGSSKLTQYGEDFLADGIIHLRHVEVGETDVQLRLRCVKMRMMNHAHNSLALTHGDDGFAVTHILARKK